MSSSERTYWKGNTSSFCSVIVSRRRPGRASSTTVVSVVPGRSPRATLVRARVLVDGADRGSIAGTFIDRRDLGGASLHAIIHGELSPALPYVGRALFKASLPAELFTAILQALDAHFFPADAPRAFEVLSALTHAGRFSILTMCLDKADTKALASIFAQLEQAHAAGALAGDADVGALRKQYA